MNKNNSVQNTNNRKTNISLLKDKLDNLYYRNPQTVHNKKILGDIPEEKELKSKMDWLIFTKGINSTVVRKVYIGA